ncbi:hypothetical protein TNCV_4730211 [Trichonephila clavipes]|nr:hypothetical protein TNCV_4730211 [Trichonephila clavipes]
MPAVQFDLSPNTEEGMGLCQCIVLLRLGGTLTGRRAASSLVRLVEKEERWNVPDSTRVHSLKIELETYCHLYGAQSYSLATGV